MSMPPGRNLLKEFPCDVFVETGSYRGDAIQLALDAGTEKIISIDIDADQIEFCNNRFGLHYEDNPLRERITLIHGESSQNLLEAIKDIPANKKITFWLDAHWQMLEGTTGGENPFPVLKELQIIKYYYWQLLRTNDPIPPNILIDDMLIFQPDIVGFSNKDVISEVEKIYPMFTIEYIANPVIKGILAAYVK